MGDVLQDHLQSLESLYLYDEKEMYLQVVEPSRTFELKRANSTCYHLFIREWNPETWALGTLKEIVIDKNTYANKFS